MALVLKDRVKEQTTTTGTGSVTLGGAVSGFETFSAVGDGNTTYYAIAHQTADEWEVGLGTYTAIGTLLSRDTILESSNSDLAVNFSAGTKDVFVTYPADKSVYKDGSDNVGIGTSSPSRKLEVIKSGVDDVNVAVIGGGSGAGGASVAVGASGTSSYIRGVNNAVSAYVPLNLGGSITAFEISGVEKMRIDSNGNVGIGTSSPSSIGGYRVLSINNGGSGVVFEMDEPGGAITRLLSDANGFAITSDGTGVGANPIRLKAGQISSATDSHVTLETTGELHMNNAAGPALLNEAATSTNPTLVPNRGDPDTGIGWVSADIGSAVAGGSEAFRWDSSGIDIINSLGNPLVHLLNSTGTPVAGTTTAELKFGFKGTARQGGKIQAVAQGDYSGTAADDASLEFYTAANDVDVLALTLGSDQNAEFEGTWGASNAAGPALMNEAAGQNNPTVVPNRADTDTGLGWNTADSFTLIAGGTRIASVRSQGVASNDANGFLLANVTPSATVPSLVPNQSDDNTGIGWVSSDIGSAVAGGAEAFRWDSSGNIQLQGSVQMDDNNVLMARDLTSFRMVANASLPIELRAVDAQPLIFKTTNTERMRIDSGGNVGIGTSSVSYPLVVYRNAATTHVRSAVINPHIDAYNATHIYQTANRQWEVGAFDTAVGLTSTWGVRDDTAAAYRLVVNSSGNVGIGTTSPTTPLTVAGKGTFSGAGSFEALELITSDTNRVYVTGNSSVSGDMWRLGTSASNPNLNIDALQSNGEILFRTGGTNERMRIDSSGNVGIGTSSPSYLTHLYSTSAEPKLVIEDASSGAGRGGKISGSWGGNGLRLDSLGASGWVYVGGSNTSYIPFTIGTEKARFHSNGYFGIGTTSPGAELDIESTSPDIHLNDSDGVLGGAITSRLIFQASGSTHGNVGFGTGSGNMALTNNQGPLFLQADTNNAHSNSYITFTVDNSAKMRITSIGNVGIGTTAPAKQLEITKSARATITSLTDAVSITSNFDAAQNFAVTLAGNRTLANPSNIDPGQTGSIFVVQDATGGRTLSFGSYWKFAGGTAPTMSTGASAVDRIDYVVQTSTAIHAVASLNLS